jgi:lipopolysaccharide transport system ATP-binding protein
MSDFAFEMNSVSKKFRKGEIHDSLRDLIPAMFGRFLKGKGSDSLQSNEFWALKDISFQVNKGEALGIIGSNGAGKSTMLKLLSRIMKPTTGYMKVNGTLSALIEVGAGFHGDLTGRENIFLNGTILGMKKEQIMRKFDEIVEFSGLADFIDTPVKRYSSGMYARLGFSVAAHVDPEILIVDEVLSVGDYTFQNKCIEKMRSVFNSGATLLFVSHNLRAVSDLCHRCILLDHGRIIKDGPAADVVRYYMNPGEWAIEVHDKKEAYISNVSLKGERGNDFLFDAGEKAFFEIEITGNVVCNNLSISVTLANDENILIFDTSTQRLYGTTISLEPGQKRKVIFELNLHLAPGTYHVSTYIYRYDIQKMYDSRIPASKIQVRSDRDVRGIVNLYPQAIIE